MKATAGRKIGPRVAQSEADYSDDGTNGGNVNTPHPTPRRSALRPLEERNNPECSLILKFFCNQ